LEPHIIKYFSFETVWSAVYEYSNVLSSLNDLREPTCDEISEIRDNLWLVSIF